MEVKILEERANPLMHRKEYRFEVDHAGAATPPRGEVRKELAKLVQVPADRLVIERMSALFGVSKSHGEAMAYASKEAADVTVREHILIRNGLRQKAAPPSPAPTAEAPAAPAAPAPKEEPKAGPAPAEPAAKEMPKEHPKPEHPKPETAHPEHPKPEHPKAEHPKPEHPKAEPPKGEHPKGEKTKGDGPKPEAAKEPHKGEGPKGDKTDSAEKPDDKAEKAEKPAKHTGKSKAAHEPKSEG